MIKFVDPTVYRFAAIGSAMEILLESSMKQLNLYKDSKDPEERKEIIYSLRESLYLELCVISGRHQVYLKGETLLELLESVERYEDILVENKTDLEVITTDKFSSTEDFIKYIEILNVIYKYLQRKEEL